MTLSRDIRKLLDWRQRAAKRFEERMRERHDYPVRRLGVNRKRKASRWETAYGSRARVKRIQRTPSVVSGKVPCENVHVVSRAAGGTWRDVVPMITAEHRELHNVGIETFQQRHGIDLRAEAERIAKEVPKDG